MIEVLFIGKIKNLTSEYEEYNDSLYSSAKTMDGFIGIDTEIVDGVEITISKWKTNEDVELWARDPQHLEAKRKVGLWYDWYRAKHFDCIDR